MVPHNKDKDNPSGLIHGKDVAAFSLRSLPSFDEPCNKPAVAAPQVPAAVEPTPVPPAVEGVELEAVKPPMLGKIETIHQGAYNKGFVTGEHNGFHAGQLRAWQEAEEALKEYPQNLGHLIARLLEPIAEQDVLIEQGMVNLVNHVARQVIQHGLHMGSSCIHQVLHEALKLLPMGAANVRIHVSPQDSEQVKALRGRHGESWWILEDDSLLPGGCRIETERSRIDAAIKTRPAQAMKQLFKQQREQTARPLVSNIRIDLDAPGDTDAP